MGEGDTPFVDAEAWLAARGVRRDQIEIPPAPAAEPPPTAPADAPSSGAGGPAVSSREAHRLAQEAMDEAVRRADEAAATPDPDEHRLEDDVAEAVAFVRRSTSVAPQSEGRLRDKLRERGTPAAAIEAALERARQERLIDDDAMVRALVEERQRKGHAPARIRRDLRGRGFDEALLDRALASAEAQDLEAAAFAVAQDKASRSTGLAAEAAYRRVANYVARRGYPEALARKVAREAVFATRDPERTAGH